MAGLGIPIVLIFLFAKCQCQDLMSKGEIPDPGISSPDTVYQPGEPGANWTPEEIDSTRERLLQVALLKRNTFGHPYELCSIIKRL